MKYTYHLCGLVFGSELKFPEFIPYEGTPDLSLTFNTTDPLPSEEDRRFKISEDGRVISFNMIGTGFFVLEDGKRIIITPEPSVDEDELCNMVIGFVLSIVLYQIGYGVFHGGVIKAYDQAFAFMGDSGAGKSTTTAALQARGYPIFSDDLLAFKKKSNQYITYPGSPLSKLCADTAQQLGVSTQNLTKNKFDKYFWKHNQMEIFQPIPLRKIYILDKCDQPSLQDLSMKESYGYLIRNWELTKLGTKILKGKRLAECFQLCTQMAKDIPIAKVFRGNDLTSLPDMINLIEEDIQQLI